MSDIIDDLFSEKPKSNPKSLSDIKIIPFWNNNTEKPDFLNKTNKEYIKFPLTELKERNIQNNLFDSIITYLPKDSYVVGGFALSLFNSDKNAKDIDFAFTSEQGFKDTYELFANPPEEEDSWGYKGYRIETDLSSFEKNSDSYRFVSFVHENPNRPKIQLLKLYFYDSPEHIIDSFDLTISQFAFDNEFMYTSPLSILDVLRKKIVLHRMQFPASTIRRIIKYTQKGYYACPGSLINICNTIKDHVGDNDIDEMAFVYLD